MRRILPPGNQQNALLEKFNRFNRNSPIGLNFQNCVFVRSNENPFIQFADFVASIYYRYYYFDKHKYKDKKKSKSLVDSLFQRIEAHSPSPPIIELSEHKVVEGNPRREQALELVSEHDIDPATAYNIVDKNITLDEVLLRRQTRTRAARRRNENKSDIQTLGELLRNRDEP